MTEKSVSLSVFGVGGTELDFCWNLLLLFSENCCSARTENRDDFLGA